MLDRYITSSSIPHDGLQWVSWNNNIRSRWSIAPLCSVSRTCHSPMWKRWLSPTRIAPAWCQLSKSSARHWAKVSKFLSSWRVQQDQQYMYNLIYLHACMHKSMHIVKMAEVFWDLMGLVRSFTLRAPGSLPDKVPLQAGQKEPGLQVLFGPYLVFKKIVIHSSFAFTPRMICEKR